MSAIALDFFRNFGYIGLFLKLVTEVLSARRQSLITLCHFKQHTVFLETYPKYPLYRPCCSIYGYTAN